MKKAAKSSLLIMIMAIILFALTGCGQDKVVATKSTSAEDNLAGVSSEETIEVSFKKDKVDKVIWNIEYEDEKAATQMASLYTLAIGKFDDLKVKQDGKKVTLTMGSKFFASEANLNEDEMTKDDIIKILEDKGYTIK